MLKLILGSALIGVFIALGMSAVLAAIGFRVDPAITGAMAGIGAGIYAARFRNVRQDHRS